MFKLLGLPAYLAVSILQHMLDAFFRQSDVHRMANKLEEFVRRIRRAALLFILSLAALLACDLLLHPIELVVWFIAMPLIGFASIFSMLWPTKPFQKKGSVAPGAEQGVSVTIARLARVRSEVPQAAKASFDLVVVRLKNLEGLMTGRQNSLLVAEAQRLAGQHLPRLVDSFLELPLRDRTQARRDAFHQALSAIAAELAHLSEQLLASRTDRFEVERQFIANRYPHDDLASA